MIRRKNPEIISIMRALPEPLSSEQLRLMAAAAVSENKIRGGSQGREKHPGSFEAVVVFKEDFLKARLPGAIKIVCK